MAYQPKNNNPFGEEENHHGSGLGFQGSADGRFARLESVSLNNQQNQSQNAPPQYGQAPPSNIAYAQPVYDESASAPAKPFNDPSVNVDGEKRFPESSPYRDWPFAIGFLVHLLGMFIVAGIYGPKMISDSNNAPTAAPGQTVTDNQNSMGIISILVVSTIVSGAVSGVWLSVMKRYADRIIHISIVCSCALLGLAAIVSFAYRSYYAAVIYLIIAVLQVWYYYSVRNRIPFAHAILASSSNALQTSWGPFVVVYGLGVVSLLWLSFWSFTFSAVQHASQNSTNGFALFFLLLSLFWTCMIIRNVGHTTTAGSVASFYFCPQLQDVTRASFIRAVTTSFGSICFGSLLVAIIHTTRVIINSLRGRGGDNACIREAVLCLVECLLGILERAVSYFNHYGYTHIAIYGYDFITASKRTWELMQAKLFTMIVNDDLTGFALWMGILLGAASGGLVGGVWSSILSFDGWLGIAIMAFLLGLVISSLFMSVIDSAVTTTFVVWAEDPQAMATNQPDNFWRIAKAAEPLYGSDPRVQQFQQV